MKQPCSRCDAPILPTTAVRTGGLCMPCFEDPEDKRGRRNLLEKMSTPDLLKRLDEAVHAGVTAAAVDAVARLAHERIYGFVLLHYIFANLNAAVLTADQLEKSICRRQERSASAPAWAAGRWSPVDSGHYPYREDLFAQSDHLFMALEGRGQENEIARTFIRALRHVRRNILTDPQIVLSVMDYTEGPGVGFYAYAELFNGPPALAKLRADLGEGPHWEYLHLERSRIPVE